MRRLNWQLAIVIVTAVFYCDKPVIAQNLDVNILKSINPQNPNSQYWINTSNSVYWVGAAVPAGTLIYGLINDDDNAKHNAFTLFATLGANMLLTDVLKNAVQKARPSVSYPGEVFPNSPPAGMSFPSGHSSLAFATATTLSLQYKKWYV
ncbi:MAG: phosphatase PAP2 family protein, partial [Sphingobacteriales bacterium]